MFLVITIDQRASRLRPDRVPELLQAITAGLADGTGQQAPAPAPIRAFERTVGDEAQGVLRTDDASLTRTLPRILAALPEPSQWWVGLGLGTGTLKATAAASRGPAFYAARRAAEAAKLPAASEHGSALEWATEDDAWSVRIREQHRRLQAADPLQRIDTFGAPGTPLRELMTRTEEARALLAAYTQLLASRSRAGQEAIAAVAVGRSQTAAAERLDISPQALGKRLAAARWRTTAQVAGALGFSLAGMRDALVGLEDAT